MLTTAAQAQQSINNNTSLEAINYKGNCMDRTGWVSNPVDNTETSNAFYVPNANRLFKGTEKPSTHPTMYYKMLCASSDRVNYKDEKGVLKPISNIQQKKK